MNKFDFCECGNGTEAKTFYGYPINWFEKCGYLKADGYIKDGKIYIDGCGGSQPIRMMNKYRKRAWWND